ncbi:hypothetical protein [Streptomyces sp. NPDC050560]|uniref:hypothetical protein n=1 Tax=Streptomyces sp. NPDC050560 TaxID=3365630 RepID=UPI00379CA1A5
MDLRDIENFKGMEESYLSLQMANVNLAENDPQALRNYREMNEMYDQYRLAYNYHYQPHLVPPSVTRQSATPPNAQEQAQTQATQQTAWAATLGSQQGGSHLAVPAGNSRPRQQRESDRRRQQGHRDNGQGPATSQKDGPKKRRRK